MLDLTLTSAASAGFPGPGFGDASSFGLTTFTSAVPVPRLGYFSWLTSVRCQKARGSSGLTSPGAGRDA